jgi:hypothetical protein
MAFMKLQSRHSRWYLVDTDNGTEIVFGDLVPLEHPQPGSEIDPDSEHWGEAVESLRDYCEGDPDGWQEIQCRECWGARLSAPGYLDCTDWTLGDTQEEAEWTCRALYGDGEDDE